MAGVEDLVNSLQKKFGKEVVAMKKATNMMKDINY